MINWIRISILLMQFTISQNMILIKRKMRIRKYLTFYACFQSLSSILFILIVLLIRSGLNQVFFFILLSSFVIFTSVGKLVGAGDKILNRYKYDYFKIAFVNESKFAKYLLSLHYFIGKAETITLLVPLYIIVGVDFGIRGILVLLILECTLYLIYSLRRIIEYNQNTIVSHVSYVLSSAAISVVSYYTVSYILRLMILSRNLIDAFGGLTIEFTAELESALVSEIALFQDLLTISNMWLSNLLNISIILYLICALLSLLLVIFTVGKIGVTMNKKEKYYAPFANALEKQLATDNPIQFKDTSLIRGVRFNNLNGFLNVVFPKENFLFISGFVAIVTQVSNPWIPIAIFHIVMLTGISGTLNSINVSIKRVFDCRSDSDLIQILRNASGNIPLMVSSSKIKLATNLLRIPLLLRSIPLVIVSILYIGPHSIYLLFSVLFMCLILRLYVRFHLSADFKVFMIEYNDGLLDADQYSTEDVLGYSFLKGYVFIPVYILNMLVNLTFLFTGFFRFLDGKDYIFIIALYSLGILLIVILKNYRLRILFEEHSYEESISSILQ